MTQNDEITSFNSKIETELCYLIDIEKDVVLMNKSKFLMQERDYIISIALASEITGKSKKLIKALIRDLKLYPVHTQYGTMVMASSLRRYIYEYNTTIISRN